MEGTLGLRELEAARARVRRGDALDAASGHEELARLEGALGALRRATGGSAQEPLPLVSGDGEPLRADGRDLVAPRWLCHLLGLRHRSVHLVLLAPRPSDLVLLQVRARWKDTAPGRLDTSVGGHVGAGRSPLDAAFAELSEELGLAREDVSAELCPLGRFFVLDASTPRALDAEVVDAWAGRLASDALGHVRFKDGEVSSLMLAPPVECARLLARGARRVAAGARAVLPRALEALERGAV